MRKFALLAVVVLIIVGCDVSQEAKELSKTNFNGNQTIEASMNQIAGLDGKVNYFMSQEQPENTNYRRLGVTISKGNQNAEYIILVDKAANGSKAETITFDGYKMTFNNKGSSRDENSGILDRFFSWGGQSESEIQNLRLAMAFSGTYPEIVPIAGVAFGQEETKGLLLASVASNNERIDRDQSYIIRDAVDMQKNLGDNRWSARNHHLNPSFVLDFILEIPPHYTPILEGHSRLNDNSLTVLYKGVVQGNVQTETADYLRIFHYFILTDIDESKL
jgi:hypothetical protein